MKRAVRCLALLCLVAALSWGLISATAQAASLDPLFGSGGLAAPLEAESGAIAEDGRGRLVVAGGMEGEFVVARYLSDGRLDPGFGAASIVQVTWNGPFHNPERDEAKANAVTVQADGAILVGGSHDPDVDRVGGARPVLVRLDENGGLDMSFGNDAALPGRVFPRGPGWRDIRAVALQRGKIVVAGETGFVARLNANGTLDRSFAGGNGTLNVPPFPRNRNRFVRLAGVTGLHVVDSGRIFAAGYANGRFLLARLHPDGRFDRRFGARGMVRVDASPVRGCRCSIGRGIARDGRGRLLVSGAILSRRPTAEFSADQADGPAALVRFRPGGKLDRSFGHGGMVRNRVERNRGFRGGTGVAVQRDGRIVVTGQLFSRLAVARYGPDGMRDAGFFGDGTFSAGFGSEFARALTPLTLSNGRIAILSEALFPIGRPRLLVIRLRP